MLKIRLSIGGAKKRPVYKIVIADSRSPRDGKFNEIKKLLIPWEANKNKTMECDKTTTNADKGDNFIKSFPTVNITFLE